MSPEDKCVSAAQELSERIMAEMKKKAVDVGAVVSAAFEKNVEETRKRIAELYKENSHG
jgi:hypothetical protein